MAVPEKDVSGKEQGSAVPVKAGMSAGLKAGIAAGIIVIGGLTGAVVYLLNRQPQETAAVVEEPEVSRRPVILTEENIDEAFEGLTNRVPTGMYQVTQNADWTFSAAGVSNDAYVENALNNPNDVYFDVVIDDTGETIYESPVLPRGGALTSVELIRKLEPGDYPCTLTYHLIDDEQNTLSTLSVVVWLHVLE